MLSTVIPTSDLPAACPRACPCAWRSRRHCPTLQELAPGKSLAQVVADGWRGGEAEVKQLAAQILETLQYLGSRRPPVTHRQAPPAVTRCFLSLSAAACVTVA